MVWSLMNGKKDIKNIRRSILETKLLLMLFAKENGIDESKVDRFLKKFEEPKTLEDLLQYPQDLLNHKEHISYLSKTMEQFLEHYVCPSRHETVTLQQMVDTIFRVRKQAHQEQDKNELSIMRRVEKEIVHEKYGSIKYEW